MFEIEPYHRWMHLYNPEEDEKSPFYGETPNWADNPNVIYNYYIHPLWDSFGSNTLYLKVLFIDYEIGYAIIEMIGEWNDAVENDVMLLKRNVIDPMVEQGVTKFIVIAENVLNFHSSDDSYYEEWNEDIKEQGGWVVILDLPDHATLEMKKAHLQRYLFFMNYPEWRTQLPQHIYQAIDNHLLRLLS